MKNHPPERPLVKDLLALVNDFEAQIQAANQNWEKMIKQKEDWETVLKETRGLLNEAERQENEHRMELAQMVMKIDH